MLLSAAGMKGTGIGFKVPSKEYLKRDTYWGMSVPSLNAVQYTLLSRKTV